MTVFQYVVSVKYVVKQLAVLSHDIQF